MIKKYSYLLFLLMIFVGGFLENHFTNKFFREFETRLDEIIFVQEEILEKGEVSIYYKNDNLKIEEIFFSDDNALNITKILSLHENNINIMDKSAKSETTDKDEELSDYEKSLIDLKLLFQWWKKGKASLHTFIPHNELREIEGLFSESITYLDLNKAEFALPKLNKLRELTINIPHGFAILIENIF